MKLILNNFTGLLENGHKYKVSFENCPTDLEGFFMLQLSVHTCMSKYFDVWMYSVHLSVNNFYSKGEYTECLRKSLLQLEENLGVQLLKSEMQIAS